MVAMIDSGWNRALSDSRVVQGIGLVDRSGDLEPRTSTDDHDVHGHGTRCTHIVLRFAPRCRILPMRVFGSSLETSPQIIAAAIEWASRRGVRLLNLSLGTTREDAIPLLYAACESARRSGTIIVAAAGSNGSPVAYPARFEPVISVNWGSPSLPFLIRYRPGAEVECEVGRPARSTVETISETGAAASSLATPVVTGLIAGWLAEDSTLSLDGVRKRLAAMGRGQAGTTRQGPPIGAVDTDTTDLAVV